MPKIEFIIVSWNAKDYLRDCLESIRNTTREIDTNTIVVDNNSSDGSIEMIRESYPWVTLVKNESNLGFAKANNIGISYANSDYICLVNSDVIIFPKAVESLYNFMESAPSIGMVGPKVYNSDRTTQYSCRKFPSIFRSYSLAFGLHRLFPKISIFTNEQMSNFSYDKTILVDSLSGCFLFVRSKAIKKVGLLDERFFMYSEDVDWCKRFWHRNWRVCFYPRAEILHHGGGSSINSPAKFVAEQNKAMLQYWRKHHNRLSVPLMKNAIFFRYFFRYFLLLFRSLFKFHKKNDFHKKLHDYRWIMHQLKKL